MSYSLIVRPAVIQDLARTVEEAQQKFGTGRALVNEITTVFGKIRERPRRYPIVYDDVHRALTSRFRFAVFFEIVEDRTEIVILAVLHQRGDPALWPKR
ncbi:MAG TPA: type II toxin-antitoxin system RelE/ParE family toxin [Gemmatimonadaceae bacterium]